MNNPVMKRVWGFALFCGGIGLCFWLKRVHDSGGRFGEILFILPPMMILEGFSQIFFPALQFSNKDIRTTPRHLIAIRYLVMIIAVAIGLTLRFTLFKEWVGTR